MRGNRIPDLSSGSGARSSSFLVTLGSGFGRRVDAAYGRVRPNIVIVA